MPPPPAPAGENPAAARSSGIPRAPSGTDPRAKPPFPPPASRPAAGGTALFRAKSFFSVETKYSTGAPRGQEGNGENRPSERRRRVDQGEKRPFCPIPEEKQNENMVEMSQFLDKTGIVFSGEGEVYCPQTNILYSSRKIEVISCSPVPSSPIAGAGSCIFRKTGRCI